MTTWVLWISKEFPSHWRLAVEHGLWDLLRPADIRAGDDVLFWQAGLSRPGFRLRDAGHRPTRSH